MRVVLFLLLFGFFLPVTDGAMRGVNYVFMRINETTDFCVNIDLSEFAVAEDVGTAAQLTLSFDFEDADLCEPPLWVAGHYAGDILLSSTSSTLQTCRNSLTGDTLRSLTAASLNASGVLECRTMDLWAGYAPYVNTSIVKTPVFAASDREVCSKLRSMKQEKKELTVQFYRPLPAKVDASFALILLISVSCIAIGGYWSGYTKKSIYHTLLAKKKQQETVIAQLAPPLTSVDGAQQAANAATSADGSEAKPPTLQASVSSTSVASQEPPSTPFNLCSVVTFLVVIVGMLLLLYFFPKIMVWFVIVVFTIATSFATFGCISFVLERVPLCTCRTPLSFAECFELVVRRPFCMSCWRERPQLRLVVLYTGCAAFSICWCIYRHEHYEYIMRDVLGVFFCISLINSLRLPSLKWITLLLSCVLVYDVFFVFLTPLFTKNKCSIMIDVASGGACSANEDKVGPGGPPDKHHEEIPVVFKVPRFGDPIFACFNLEIDLEYPPALLGFGDIILPGILVAFASGFDQIWRVRGCAYFVLATIGYAVGMTVTFVALVLMEKGQPALIYLVPCTLIPTHVLALVRKEWRLLWTGEYPEDITLALLGDGAKTTGVHDTSGAVEHATLTTSNSAQSSASTNRGDETARLLHGSAADAKVAPVVTEQNAVRINVGDYSTTTTPRQN